MFAELRIISGTLRGRKLKTPLDPKLRPMSDRARGALFSILGDAVPDRTFIDVFAGSGAVGLEALSRGASRAVFIEKDGGSVTELLKRLKTFGVAESTQVLQADAYRWGEKGALPPDEPANVFLGPPYPDFAEKPAELQKLTATLRQRLAPGSVLILQSDGKLPEGFLGDEAAWDQRTYGRTQLSIWVKPLAAAAAAASAGEVGATAAADGAS